MKQNRDPFTAKSQFRPWAEHCLTQDYMPYIKQSTLDNYRAQLEKQWYPALADKRLKAITPQVVQDCVGGITKHYASSTVNASFRLVKAIFARAVQCGILRSSPCAQIRMPKRAVQKPRVLNLHEQRALELLAKEKHFEFILGLYSGLRVGELCALKWSDVDFDNGSIIVHHTLQRIRQDSATAVIETTPKSSSSAREIPLPQSIIDELQALYHQDGQTDGYVFRSNRGKFVDVRTMQRRLKRAAKMLQLEDVHFHTLRHTYATRCLEASIGYETLSELLGHSSPTVTLSCYAHCTFEHKRAVIAALEVVR